MASLRWSLLHTALITASHCLYFVNSKWDWHWQFWMENSTDYSRLDDHKLFGKATFATRQRWSWWARAVSWRILWNCWWLQYVWDISLSPTGWKPCRSRGPCVPFESSSCTRFWEFSDLVRWMPLCLQILLHLFLFQRHLFSIIYITIN